MAAFNSFHYQHFQSILEPSTLNSNGSPASYNLITIFERRAGSDAPCSRSGGDRRILFSKRVARLCKAVNKGSLEGSPSQGDPFLAWGVPWSGDPLAQGSPGPGIVPRPGDCPLARGLSPSQGIVSWPGGCPLTRELSPAPGIVACSWGVLG